MIKKPKIFIAGHMGMVGSSVLRIFEKSKRYNIVTVKKKELDLLNQKKVYNFLKNKKFDAIIICAARAGGIHANNTLRTNFIFENLQIQNNLIYGSHLANIKKLIFLGSSCIYPKESAQPMKEEYLLSGPLEPTNEPYSIAKISGIKLCEALNFQFKRDYRCLMPTNLYGINDNFDLSNSHVIPALIRKFHEAKIKNKKNVTIWGSGKVYRDFLYVDDLALAIYKVFNLSQVNFENLTKNVSHLNVGSGYQLSIKELSKIIKKITQYHGELKFDKTKPDGMKLKLLDISRIKKIQWKPKISLEQGLSYTYKFYTSKKNKNEQIKK